MSLTRIEKMNEYKVECDQIDAMLTIENKIFLIEDSIDRFEDFYNMASCDMCCGGGNEHWDDLNDFGELLDHGHNVHFYDFDERLFD